MITTTIARDLLGHMEWADAEVWRALHATPASLEDEKLMNLVLHLHVVQRAFLNMWTNQNVPPEELYAKRDSPTLLAWARSYYPAAHAFLDTAEPRLEEKLEMPWVAGHNFQMPTVGETMIQVPMHSTYHRGQVNLRLREIGGEPPLVDYIAWLWFGRPAARWP
ncbi:MAG TPA: DinB family protein [Thermoanaerobaculia bacterium]|nr:DinB family protein [Thermoanaerobaculia bacterium]